MESQKNKVLFYSFCNFFQNIQDIIFEILNIILLSGGFVHEKKIIISDKFIIYYANWLSTNHSNF